MRRMSTTPPPTSSSYYAILNVPVGASENEIRNAYKRLARKYHPDRRAVEKLSNPQQSEHDEFGELRAAGISTYDELFSLISAAYETLGNTTKRLHYDVENGLVKTGTEEYQRKMQHLQRYEAENAAKLMTVSFDIKRNAELNRGGLVIDDAWYGSEGAAKHHHLDRDQETRLASINVTRQLQCLVENSKLVIPGKESKAGLVGFWDPCPGEAKCLSVKYFFKGRLHETRAGDEEMLLIPVKHHLVQQQKRSRYEDKINAENQVENASGKGQMVRQDAKNNKAAELNGDETRGGAMGSAIKLLNIALFAGIVVGSALSQGSRSEGRRGWGDLEGAMSRAAARAFQT